MTATFAKLDWLLLVGYFLLLVGLGWRFAKRSHLSADQFTTGGRQLSGWLCGLSIFATFLSSITFLALPGAAFDSDWNPLVFSLTLPIAAWVAVRWFLPYYRQSREASAYAMMERRFGLWARWMASAFFLAFQMARMSFVLYLMALPLSMIFSWDIYALIFITGLVVMIYASIGGIVAVMWADAIQAIVLTAGAVIALLVIWSHLEHGPWTVWQIAATQPSHKFALGTWGWPPWSSTAFWLILGFGIFENLKNFGVDQNYVQRYVSARPAEAVRSVWLGAMLYLPVSGLFLLIGTSLFAFYHQNPAAMQAVQRIAQQQRQLNTGGVSIEDGERENGDSSVASAAAVATPPAALGDRVFPHFIAHYLPPGILGLLVAAIFSAAMSTVSTSLNSAATIILSDFYLRGWAPRAPQPTQIRVLRTTTVVLGCLATAGACGLVSLTASALDAWWAVSSVLGAGILGLFLLGRVVPGARPGDAIWGLSGGLLVVGYIVFGPHLWDKKLAIVVGSLTVVGLGWLASRRAGLSPLLDSDSIAN